MSCDPPRLLPQPTPAGACRSAARILEDALPGAGNEGLVWACGFTLTSDTAPAGHWAELFGA